jgi:hypothetical protein
MREPRSALNRLALSSTHVVVPRPAAAARSADTGTEARTASVIWRWACQTLRRSLHVHPADDGRRVLEFQSTSRVPGLTGLISRHPVVTMTSGSAEGQR